MEFLPKNNQIWLLMETQQHTTKQQQRNNSFGVLLNAVRQLTVLILFDKHFTGSQFGFAKRMLKW